MRGIAILLQLQICTPLMITEVPTFFHVYCAILHLLIQSMKIHCLFYRGPSFRDCSVGVLLFWTQALRYVQHLLSSPPCLSLSQRLNEQTLSVSLCSTMCIFSFFWLVLFLLCLNTYSSLPFHFLEPSVLQLDLPSIWNWVLCSVGHSGAGHFLYMDFILSQPQLTERPSTSLSP